MTFQQFLETYNGKYVDLDNAYGAQCMDLLHLYCSEVLGLSDPAILRAAGPKAIWENWDSGIVGTGYFDRIPNTPEGIPQEGDILLWGSGTYGHVAVYIDGDVNRLRSFDQNYPTGSPCHIQEHNYTSMLGWLHPHKDTCQAKLDKCQDDRNGHWNVIIWCCDKLDIPHDEDRLKTEVENLMKIDDMYQQKQNDYEEAEVRIENLEAEVRDLQGKQITMKGDMEELQKELTKKQQTIQDMDSKLSTVSEALERLKKEAVDGLSGWELIIKGIARILGR